MSNTGYKYISQTERKGHYVFTPPAWVGANQKTYSTLALDEAVQIRNEIMGHNPDKVEVKTKPNKWEVAELWERAVQAQEKVEQTDPGGWHDITIDSGGQATVVALMSDLHLGSPYTDYKSILEDTDIIEDTEGMHLVVVGDERDNFILRGLSSARFGAEMSLPSELQMYRDWLQRVEDKTLAYVTGNHDLWTYKTSGLDVAQMLLPENVLYDPHVLRMKWHINGFDYKVKLRHKWPGTSIYNWTHGIERAWRDEPFDIGIGGHTHQATLCREFVRDGQLRLAILMGTYKNLGDKFGDQIGHPASPHKGSAAVMFHPDGHIQWFRELHQAAQYLNYLRGSNE